MAGLSVIDTAGRRLEGFTPEAPRSASRLDGLAGEGALEVLARARALEAEGREVLHLEVGEPDWPVAAHVVEAGVRAIRDGETRYGPAAGLPELRAAIADAHRARGLDAAAEQVIVTPGAKPALLYALLALVEPGAEVLVPDPGFPPYASVVRFAGGVPVPYPAEAVDRPEVLERLTSARTRVLVLNSPNNPTGHTLDDRALARVAEVALRRGLLVVSDEIYARLRYNDYDDADGLASAPSIAAVPGMAERTVVVDGFSKAYAMTGWRLGHLVAPAWLAPRLATLAMNGHTCTPAFVQRAGIAALRGPQDGVRDMVRALRRRRDVGRRALEAIPGVRCAPPGGAFYLWPDLRARLAGTSVNAATVAARLLDAHGVAALAGTAFGPGGAGHLRLSFAANADHLALAIQRLARCLDDVVSTSTSGARP